MGLSSNNSLQLLSVPFVRLRRIRSGTPRAWPSPAGTAALHRTNLYWHAFTVQYFLLHHNMWHTLYSLLYSLRMASSKKTATSEGKKQTQAHVSARLKKQLKNGQEHVEGAIYLRLHRAISWLHAAEQNDQADERFVFLWIAFNACYANELVDLSKTKSPETSMFSVFIKRIIERDTEQQIYKLLWVRYSQEIRLLLDNQYIYKVYWDFIHGVKTEHEFKRAFELSNRQCVKAFGKGNAVFFLIELLRRLYTLRNQVFHGGATYNGRVNREQINDASAILMRLVPIIIEIMIEHKTDDWGTVLYPPINTP